MLSASQAFERARAEAAEGVVVRRNDVRELENGWFFPWHVPDGDMVVGSNGVIVNKSSGECFHLGSAFPVERDFLAYDAGYMRESYDLRITSVIEKSATLDFLQSLGISVVEPELAHGVTWRIPRRLAREELARLLQELPCTFRDVGVYFRVEQIEKARESNWCDFELLEPDHSEGA